MTTEVVDGAETKADATLSEGQKQTPTYSQEQMDKALRDTRSAVLADAGRFKAEAEKALRAAQDAQARLIQMEKERQEAELEAVKDEPDMLARIRLQQQLRVTKSELDKAREELNFANASLADWTTNDSIAKREATVKEVAAKKGVNVKILSKMAKFTDGTVEAIEDIAKELPKETSIPPLEPDSNRTLGGTLDTVQQVKKDYIAGKITAEQRIKKLAALGVRP